MIAALDKTTTQLVGPDGSVVNLPTVILSDEEARLLRTYKKFLARHGLREALYCNNCWNKSEQDLCSPAFVTNAKIGIACRCRNRYYQGQTF